MLMYKSLKKTLFAFLFCWLCHFSLNAASFPAYSYKSTGIEHSATTDFPEQVDPFESSDPMLGGPPVLPPDPGEEVPIGDNAALLLLIFIYAAWRVVGLQKSKQKA